MSFRHQHHLSDHDYFYKSDLEYAENEIYEGIVNIFEKDHSYSHCSSTNPILIENQMDRSDASDFRHKPQVSDHCTLSYADVVKQEIKQKCNVTTQCSPQLITEKTNSRTQSSTCTKSQTKVTTNNPLKYAKKRDTLVDPTTPESYSSNTPPEIMDCTTSNSLSQVHITTSPRNVLLDSSSCPPITSKNSLQKQAVIKIPNSIPSPSSKMSIDDKTFNVYSVPSDGNCFFHSLSYLI